MKAMYAYVILALLAVVLLHLQFALRVRDSGLDVSLLVKEIASSGLAAFGWLDVVVSALALLVFILAEDRRYKVPRFWSPILGTLTVVVSLGPPLYLYLRGINREYAA